jgi:hypothetical protein
MSDIAKKVLWSIVLSIPSAAVGAILRGVFQAWGVFDPLAEWLGGWLKIHVTQAQVEWTIAGILALLAYAALLWIVWRYHHIQPIAGATLSADISQSQRGMKVSTTDIGQQGSSPQGIGSPLQIEFGNDVKHERTQHFDETGIFRRTIHISVFNVSLDDIPDCNLRLIAATPRPNTGDNPTTFPAHFGVGF